MRLRTAAPKRQATRAAALEAPPPKTTLDKTVRNRRTSHGGYHSSSLGTRQARKKRPADAPRGRPGQGPGRRGIRGIGARGLRIFLRDPAPRSAKTLFGPLAEKGFSPAAHGPTPLPEHPGPVLRGAEGAPPEPTLGSPRAPLPHAEGCDPRKRPRSLPAASFPEFLPFGDVHEVFRPARGIRSFPTPPGPGPPFPEAPHQRYNRVEMFHPFRFRHPVPRRKLLWR